MEVTQIFVYPVKSLGGISLSESYLTEKGLKYDRRWLLVDGKNKLITQRSHPQLVLFYCKLVESGIEVTYSKDGSHCLIPFVPSQTASKEFVGVWDDEVEVMEVDAEVNQWFSERIGEKVRLMFQPDDSFRPIDARYAVTPADQVSVADGYPVLIISEASLADLNKRLQEPVEMLRFRPNLVIGGTEVYEEDTLESIRIGKAGLKGVKNCGRCIMITNDPVHAVLAKEPLKTLSSYRKVGSKVIFGRNFLVRNVGRIKVGDRLEMLS